MVPALVPVFVTHLNPHFGFLDPVLTLSSLTYAHSPNMRILTSLQKLVLSSFSRGNWNIPLPEHHWVHGEELDIPLTPPALTVPIVHVHLQNYTMIHTGASAHQVLGSDWAHKVLSGEAIWWPSSRGQALWHFSPHIVHCTSVGGAFPIYSMMQKVYPRVIWGIACMVKHERLTVPSYPQNRSPPLPEAVEGKTH